MTISASAFTFVSDLVKQQAAIVIGPGKEYLVESRLLPLARDAGLDDVGALIARLQGSQDDVLRRQIVEAMTTNETSSSATATRSMRSRRRSSPNCASCDAAQPSH